MSPELRKLMVAIPVVHMYGKPAIRVSDFASHYDELILSILPAEDWFVLTAHGEPICEVHVSRRFARVAFRRALQDEYFAGIEDHDGVLYVQKTDFTKHRSAVLARVFTDIGAKDFTVCWRGWPDFEVRRPRYAKRLSYTPVVEPLPGQRGVENDADKTTTAE